MKKNKSDLIRFCVDHQVIRFGEIVLKSGRKSPYFFNAGLFQTGQALALLGEFYAESILQSGIKFDVLLGPAYKGIPLVSAAAIKLSENSDHEYPYCFNRKEVKDHGEGGQLVGAPLSGRVLIIDDVITAGTAVGECMQLIEAHSAQLAGVVVILDRQERGHQDLSATQEIEKKYGAPVINIICLDDILDYVEKDESLSTHFSAIDNYRQEYGV